MALRVYNTLSGQKEEFQPLLPDKVTMYVCGPTVYDNSHIGHAMSAVVFDVIKRYLEFKGYKVQHAQNFTDIDDKIINRAIKENVTWQSITERYINQFLAWMDALNVQRATVYPRATADIEDIKTTIQQLIDNGHAYPASGDVYFRVSSKPEYGELKHQSIDELLIGARIAPDEIKENALDFALWKGAKPGEPSWDSPWGPGRPGWHIECSAMVTKHLGEQVDIHGGGADLIFPHHENEIAQSECATGKRPFARYWMHNGLLQLGDEKMSKSLGNFVTVGDILENYDADTLRFFVLGSIYRNPLKYSEETLKGAQRGLERLKLVFTEDFGASKIWEGNLDATTTLRAQAATSERAFISAMDDDFNTAQALSVLFDLLREIYRGRDQGASSKSLSDARNTLKKLGNDILGLRLDQDLRPKTNRELTKFKDLVLKTREELAGAMSSLLGTKIQEKLKELDLSNTDSVAGYIELLRDIRIELKADKQFQLADNIRQRLKELGVKLEDRADGTTWKFK